MPSLVLTFVAHTTPWHLICFFFTSWILRALTAPVLKQEKKILKIKCKLAIIEIILTLGKHLLLVGIHVKTDFVACVKMDVTLHIIRSVGKVEHFLWKARPLSKYKGFRTNLLTSILFHIQDKGWEYPCESQFKGYNAIVKRLSTIDFHTWFPLTRTTCYF